MKTSRVAVLALAAALAGVAVAAPSAVLSRKDISPDQSNFVGTSPGNSDPAGRIMSLVIDPNDDTVLYAAAEFSGVWKSTTGATWIGGPNAHSTAANLQWFQSSRGLRNGLTADNTSLAVDASNSKRLLYATTDNDGRPPSASGTSALGGLWVSLDAADTWSHRSPLCATPPDGIISVVFAGGAPLVGTACGIVTTSSATLEGPWTQVSSMSEAVLANGGGQTVFACSGTQVQRSRDLGATWDPPISLGGACFGITAVPPRVSGPSSQVLVVRSVPTKTACTAHCQEVTLVDFDHTPAQRGLGFASVALDAGSGQSAVAAVPIPSAKGSTDVAGVTYDIYASDGCAWYAFDPTGPTTWHMVANIGAECDSNTTGIHADSWAMTFPHWYDPAKGYCAAYASSDGGVFFYGTHEAAPIVGGCVNAANWGLAQNGLHVLYSNVVNGYSYFSFTCSHADGCDPPPPDTTETLVQRIPDIFLATGDNDVFFRDGTTGQWSNFDALGDAGQVTVDYGQALLARNGDYVAYLAAPGSASASLLPKTPAFDNGEQGTGSGDLTQVITPRKELFTAPLEDYLAVENFDLKNCSKKQVDVVVRNTTSNLLTTPTKPGTWVDLSPKDHFLACDIRKVQAAGGHANPTVYVLTTLSDKQPATVFFTKGRGPGQIYRGEVVAGQRGPEILQWVSASGAGTTALGSADNFFVNPFDASEIYAVDVRDQVIKVSRDSGGHWEKESELTDIATNHGEYVFGCKDTVRGPADPFCDACSMSWMSFDIFHPGIRAAAMMYGGIAFSRDDGNHWISLDVTDNNHFVSDNLTEPVVGVFFNQDPFSTPSQFIDASIKGKSLIEVSGPFLTLESLNFTYTPKSTKCNPSPPAVVSVEILTKGLAQKIPMRGDASGVCHGSLLFDSGTAKTIQYRYVGDGTGSVITYNLSSTDLKAGEANVSN